MELPTKGFFWKGDLFLKGILSRIKETFAIVLGIEPPHFWGGWGECEKSFPGIFWEWGLPLVEIYSRKGSFLLPGKVNPENVLIIKSPKRHSPPFLEVFFIIGTSFPITQ